MEIISRASQPLPSIIFRFLGICFTFFAIFTAYLQPFQVDDLKNVPLLSVNNISLGNSAFHSDLFVEKLSRVVAFFLTFYIAICFGYVGLVQLKFILPNSSEQKHQRKHSIQNGKIGIHR
jgi:hypothetical protein